MSQILRLNATMSRFCQVLVTSAVILSLASADPVTPNVQQGVDVKAAARQMVTDIRSMVVLAKSGNYLSVLRSDALKLHTTASDLLTELPGQVLDCDVQLTTKMAAARTGSHEVLTVMLANDPLSVLNGRLSMSLAFLEEVSHLMGDELSLNDDVGPHLTAIIFGTNVTLDIIDTADETVKTMAVNQNDVKTNPRVRRQAFPPTSLPLGGGFSLGNGGVQWTSRSGAYNIGLRPHFADSIIPDGATLSFKFNF